MHAFSANIWHENRCTGGTFTREHRLCEIIPKCGQFIICQQTNEMCVQRHSSISYVNCSQQADEPSRLDKWRPLSMSVADGASYRCCCILLPGRLHTNADNNRATDGRANNMVGVLFMPYLVWGIQVPLRPNRILVPASYVRYWLAFWSSGATHHKRRAHNSTNRIGDVFDDKHRNGVQSGIVRSCRLITSDGRIFHSQPFSAFNASNKECERTRHPQMSAGMC